MRPELVVEVRYDKVQGRRFRHGTKLLRLRPDKDPAQCTWHELRPPLDAAPRRSPTGLAGRPGGLARRSATKPSPAKVASDDALTPVSETV